MPWLRTLEGIGPPVDCICPGLRTAQMAERVAFYGGTLFLLIN